MLSRLKASVMDEVLSNKVQYLVVVFFLVVGITAGTYTINRMSGQAHTELSEYIQLIFSTVKKGAIDHFTVFLYAWLQNTIVFATITAFSLLMIGIPLIAAVVILKGFCVGFTAGVLVLGFGSGGFVAIVVAMLLPALVLLPCVCKAAVLGTGYSVTVIKMRRVPQTPRDRMIAAKPMFSRMLRVYAAAMIGVIIEALLSPALMQLI